MKRLANRFWSKLMLGRRATERRVDLRTRELLEKARQRTITYEEGQELLKLLEELKKRHESAGDYWKATLAGMMILFTMGALFSMFGERFTPVKTSILGKS